MYDRSKLHDAVLRKGDTTRSGRINTAAVARRLDLAPGTAWRLVVGRGEPSSPVVAAVERHYGVTANDLLIKRAAA